LDQFPKQGHSARPTLSNTIRPNYGPSRRNFATFYGQVCYRSSAVIGVGGPLNKDITEGGGRGNFCCRITAQFASFSGLVLFVQNWAVIRFCDIFGESANGP
jgi:hypothetical protein